MSLFPKKVEYPFNLQHFSVHVLHLVDISINAQTHKLQCIFY